MSRNALKLAVIGGGSSYTPELVEGVLKRLDFLPVKQLHFVDIEAGAENYRSFEILRREWSTKLELTLKLKRALIAERRLPALISL